MSSDSWNPGSLVWVESFGLPWWPAIIVDPEEIPSKRLSLLSYTPDKHIVRLINHPSDPVLASASELRPFACDDFTRQQLDHANTSCSSVSGAIRMAINLFGEGRNAGPISAADQHKQPELYHQRDSFSAGTVLWVSLPGFPWWPARVIDISEVDYTPTEDEKFAQNLVLVMFFYDNNRFCFAEKGATRPFRMDEFYESRMRYLHYRGKRWYQISRAVDEAWDFAKARLSNPTDSQAVGYFPCEKRRKVMPHPVRKYVKRKKNSSPAGATPIGTPSHSRRFHEEINSSSLDSEGHDTSKHSFGDVATVSEESDDLGLPDRTISEGNTKQTSLKTAPKLIDQACLNKGGKLAFHEKSHFTDERGVNAKQALDNDAAGLSVSNGRVTRSGQVYRRNPSRGRVGRSLRCSNRKVSRESPACITNTDAEYMDSNKRVIPDKTKAVIEIDSSDESDSSCEQVDCRSRGGKKPIHCRFVRRAPVIANGLPNEGKTSDSEPLGSKHARSENVTSTSSSSDEQKGSEEIGSSMPPDQFHPSGDKNEDAKSNVTSACLTETTTRASFPKTEGKCGTLEKPASERMKVGGMPRSTNEPHFIATTNDSASITPLNACVVKTVSSEQRNTCMANDVANIVQSSPNTDLKFKANSSLLERGTDISKGSGRKHSSCQRNTEIPLNSVCLKSVLRKIFEQFLDNSLKDTELVIRKDGQQNFIVSDISAKAQSTENKDTNGEDSVPGSCVQSDILKMFISNAVDEMSSKPKCAVKPDAGKECVDTANMIENKVSGENTLQRGRFESFTLEESLPGGSALTTFDAGTKLHVDGVNKRSAEIAHKSGNTSNAPRNSRSTGARNRSSGKSLDECPTCGRSNYVESVIAKHYRLERHNQIVAALEVAERAVRGAKALAMENTQTGDGDGDTDDDEDERV